MPLLPFLLLTLSTLTILTHAQTHLPKEPPLPWCNLYATDTVTSNMTDYWKVNAHGWSTVVSAYPIRPNAVTTVTFQNVNGGSAMIGVGVLPDATILRTQYVGLFPNSVAFSPFTGKKVFYGGFVDYSTPCVNGDTITMTVDLRPYQNTVEYAKNGLSMGVAFAGLNMWAGEIYLMFSIHAMTHRLRVTNYSVVL